jgi:hypothetical protein
MKGRYQLVVRYEFDAIDNVEARIESDKILSGEGYEHEGSVKLQKVVDGQSPEGVIFTPPWER